MSRRRRHLALAGLVSLASGVGCSLVYSYGTVEEKAKEGADGSLDDANVAVDAPSTMDRASGDDDTTPEAAPGDAGAAVHDADAAPLPQAGAVVIGGVGTGSDGGMAYVLSVLDPTTGHELSREDMAVVGLAHDGVTGADVWYIFETLNPGGVLTLGPFPPAPGDPVVLHVRKLDTNTGIWTELTKLAVPTIASADLVAPLTNRLTYVAYPPVDAGGDAGSGDVLAVLDTTTPANTSADPADPAVSMTPIGFSPSGAVGTRPSLMGDQGGEVTLVQNTSTGAAGNFQFVTAKVSASSVTISSPPVVVAPSSASFATIGVGSFLSAGPANVFALPEQGDASATIVQYSPSSGMALTASPVPFAATSVRFRPLAISECSQMVFVAQLTGTTLFAVPLANGGTGTPTSFDVSHSVSNVRYEPFTGTAVAAFNGGAGYELSALTLGGSLAAPTLSPRTSLSATRPWAPPGDLRPTTIAVRQPIPFACP